MSGSSEATSFQLPAPSFCSACASFVQLLHQAGEHTPHFFQFPREFPVQVHGQKLEVAGKKEIILKFVAGTQGMPEESAEVWIRTSPRTFSDIGGDRQSRAKHLIAQGPCVRLSEVRRKCVRRQCQTVSL